MTHAAHADRQFTWHGTRAEQPKRELFARSEVFVLSSPREGFSIATLEAMAQGCCAIVVNDPAKPNGALDFVRHGEQGLCVAPGLEAMRQALQTLLHDPDLRLRLRRGAWKMASSFRIERQATLLIEYYTSIQRALPKND
jgi:glycosyltransferase involved in cell wall biosynthesis